MAEKKPDDRATTGGAKALTVATVQKLIDAAFVRFELAHGHLSADDAAAKLAALETDD